MAVLPQYRIKEFWTGSIEDVGVSVRVSFFMLIQRQDNDELEWHYFGITEADRPRPSNTDVPFTEHSFVNFPSAMNDLPDMRNVMDPFYELAKHAGMNDAGVVYYD